MQPLTTVYRALVMVATGVIVVKGWQYCGPSLEQVKAIAGRAAEIGQEAWGRIRSPGDSGTQVVAIPATTAPETSQQRMPADVMPPNIGAMRASQASFIAQGTPSQTVSMAPPNFPQPAPAEESMAGTVEKSPNLPAANASSLSMLLTRLKELGGIEPALTPWGASGNLYRFCCRATLADNPQVTRHFEAVADEQLVAVESVVAKIQSWRTERQRSQP